MPVLCDALFCASMWPRSGWRALTGVYLVGRSSMRAFQSSARVARSELREQDEAHIPTEQPEACPETWLPAPYVDPRRPGRPESASPPWSREALRLRRSPAEGRIRPPERKCREARRPRLKSQSSESVPTWSESEVVPPLPLSGAPAGVPAPARSGYTTNLRNLQINPVGSPIPYHVVWARPRSETGVGAAFVRPLERSCGRCRLGPTSSASSQVCGTSRSRN